ncbi:hypothetical protein J6590_078314 [Homalodisca vitripennis]|nr:hypothetical protein J6590_078314 [Homalodisca vitripennis]
MLDLQTMKRRKKRFRGSHTRIAPSSDMPSDYQSNFFLKACAKQMNVVRHVVGQQLEARKSAVEQVLGFASFYGSEMDQAIFQHGGVPPHSANPPPRSPDLTVCDFFLWGYLKEQVYTRSFNNDEELKQSIEEDLLR